ncbi:MAG: MEKHLA domain-containing protein [Cyanobacteria bacterium P01_F01_bin.143]
MSNVIWMQPQVIDWSQILLDSFEHFLGYQLILRDGDQKAQAQALFEAPFVVVSHEMQADPILNYGNQTALELWSMTWEELTQTPSRLTAEPMNREKRELILRQVARQGYIDNYTGVRISSTGTRFLIEKTIIWNLVNRSGDKCGQAATFAHWTILEELK